MNFEIRIRWMWIFTTFVISLLLTMTLINELYLDMLKMYLHTKNELSGSRLSKVTALQTDRCDWVRGGSREVSWVRRMNPPHRQTFFWSNTCREGAEFGEVNRLGWPHEREDGVVETSLEELSLKRTECDDVTTKNSHQIFCGKKMNPRQYNPGSSTVSETVIMPPVVTFTLLSTD